MKVLSLNPFLVFWKTTMVGILSIEAIVLNALSLPTNKSQAATNPRLIVMSVLETNLILSVSKKPILWKSSTSDFWQKTKKLHTRSEVEETIFIKNSNDNALFASIPLAPKWIPKIGFLLSKNLNSEENGLFWKYSERGHIRFSFDRYTKSASFLYSVELL